MLLALVFRGVSFEYRWRTKRWKRVWDWAFSGGSYVAAFAQGITLGALVQGIEVEGRAYAGGWWDWLTPFSIMCGIAVVAGYALLGVTWLIMRCEGSMADRMRDRALPVAFAVLAFIGAVSIATPFLDEVYFQRWFSGPGAMFAFGVPVLLGVAAFAFRWGLETGRESVPFLASLGFFVVSFIGIGISFYPMMVPPALTIEEAAAPQSSLLFALVGAVILIPIILAYTAYAYWVFRGKIDPEEGYH
jgi:cytochrome d ubiquinol oxidase subunit II